MALCHVTGLVYLPNGQLARSRAFVFKKDTQAIQADYLGTVLPEHVHAKTDSDGNIDVYLISGTYSVYARGSGEYYVGRVGVPDEVSADFSDVLTIADPTPPVPAWLAAVQVARDEAVQAAEDAAESAATVAGMQDGIDQAIADSADALSAADDALEVAQSVSRSAGVTPMDFGAVGDGVADDTLAIREAARFSGVVNWLDRTYRVTDTITVSLTGPAVWRSNGAVIKLDRADVISRAMFINVAGFPFSIEGSRFTVDANRKAFTAFRVNNVTSPNSPEFTATGVIARNAYRASTSFTGGDGIYVNGGFTTSTLIRCEAHDCHMAPGAWVSGSQGIFGITIAQEGSRYSKNIVIRDPVVRNIWDEDATNTADQDAIRTFQDINDPDATCFIVNVVCENVLNRTIKLHSGPNCIVDGVRRVLDASVVPQTSNPSNPDIDAQQAPASIRNVWVHYKGRCHTSIVNGMTDRGQYYYRGALVDGVSGLIEGLPGNTITAVNVTNSGSVVQQRAQIRNINLIGPILRAVSIRLTGAGSSFASVSGVMGEFTSTAISTDGAGSGSLHVQANDLINTGASVPLSSGFTGLRTIAASGQHGFS